VIGGLVIGVLFLGNKHFSVVGALDSSFAVASIVMQLFAIAVGLAVFAGEFATGTIIATAAVSPRRDVLIVGKLLSASAFVAPVALASGFMAGGATLLISSVGGHPVRESTLWLWLRFGGGLALGSVAVAVLVAAIGVLVRQHVLTVLIPIVVLYLFPLVVGSLPPGAVQNSLIAALPSTALSALASQQAGAGAVTIALFSTGDVAIGVWAAILLLMIWCLPVVILGAVVFLRRDLTPSSGARAPRKSISSSRGRRQSAPYRNSLGNLLLSELRKTWSLPTVRWIAVISILIQIGYGVARASSRSILTVGGTRAVNLNIELVYAVTDGIGIVAVLLAAVAAIQVAGEFETGTAIPTFTAAHRRGDVTGSKILCAMITAVAVGLAAMVVTSLIVVPIYAARGYVPTADSIAVAASSIGKGLLFLALTTVMSAGIAGWSRRIVTTVISACVLLVIGPALLNSILGFARLAKSPFVIIGNGGRFLPWEGSRFYEPPDGVAAFAAVDSHGVLNVSDGFGIVITIIWAAVVVVVWALTDVRRPITTRN
jgi:ABC-type transport system involved in multi-copper enzyme maturation permease subunit